MNVTFFYVKENAEGCFLAMFKGKIAE